ncbi:DNA polymerase III subunit chi [Litorivita sp. NS0012-18]|uniref:DNA polymerase III subunit chi n=1 Tax=Litorivita sp. NS0012-18 TaxID=3127655 RepID=UPI0031057B6D
MGAAYFYHLTRSPLERSLPMLLGKAREAGWRVALRGRDPARLRRLDDLLWEGAPESFLPHGLWDGPAPQDQPILLLPETAHAANAPDCLMAIDGAQISAAEVEASARVCIIFDGNDPAAVEAARGQWKAITKQGATAQYWSEEGGGWEMKAQS